MALELAGRISAADDVLNADLRQLRIIAGDGAGFLYAATGQNGGISVWSLSDTGGLARLSDSVYFTVSGVGIGHFEPVLLDARPMVILTGTGAGKLVNYTIATDGGLSANGPVDLPGNATASCSALAAAALAVGTTALYLADAATGMLRATVSDGLGGIAADAGLAGKAAAYQLSGSVSLALAQAGGAQFLLAADAGVEGVRSYRIDPGSGGLTAIDSLGAADGLGIATPTALETVTAHGATWIVLAAAGSGSLSVMRLLPGGDLVPTDHLLDTRATRFSGVSALKVIEADGHVFVLAGGSDDGISLFSLLPDGQLVHLQSLADAAGLGLDNVTAIEAVRIGGALQIFVSSGGDAGLSQFTLDLGDLGQVIAAGSVAADAPLAGTPQADLLLGQAGGPTLQGRDGNDILVAGAAGGSLTGGAGADIFVLGPSAGTLRITDFEPGSDRLDLSRFPMLRGVDQLDLTATSWGMRLIHGATRIDIHSAGGGPLGAFDLWPGGFDTPDRIPVPGIAPGLVATGTRGADILAGTAWGDTIRGLAGADRVRGGAGRDILKGGAGNDILKGGGDRDRLVGGDGRDALKGGAGRDILKGGDGRDRLLGQHGDDRMTGGGGPDLFIFASRHGDDRITDFAPGLDRIRLDLPGFDFAVLDISNHGGDALIDTGAGTIILIDVLPGSLSAQDFLFS